MGGGGDDHDEVDGPLSEEGLARRPEVRIINKYALGRAYLRIALKGMGALALMWASVVLLGGFVTVLKQVDFWNLTLIAFVQAARLSNAMGDDRFAFLGKWIGSLNKNFTSSWGKKHHREDNNWFHRQYRIITSKVTDFLMFVIFYPVSYFVIGGPAICIGLSVFRLTQQDYGSDGGDGSTANLKPALNLFYRVSVMHSVISLLVILLEYLADRNLVDLVCRRYGFNLEVVDGYFRETKRMCVNNPVSAGSWNLIAYGAGLLDSELPEDYASGAKVVTMLIELDIPIRRVLIRSPGRRIQKLIRTLVWRSPVEGEMRWLAAKIVEHIACDLNLAQFPGAPECVSSLLDTSYHDNAEQEAHQLPIQPIKTRGKKPATLLYRIICLIQWFWTEVICGRTIIIEPEQDVDSKAARGTNENLILQGLTILENLARDQHNCIVICNTKGLVSKITAPLNSNRLTQDIEINATWIQVVDTSLKVVRHLVQAHGDTGEEICRQIADSSNAVGNLEAILGIKSSTGSIIELQMRAMEVLAELFLHGSTSWDGNRTENFIERREIFIKMALYTFLTVNWVGPYLAEEKKKNEMEGAMETVSRLKEKAGEALVMLLLSMDSQINLDAIRSFTNVVHSLGEIMTSKTMKCNISETEIVEAEMKIGCRISAAVILKNLCPHFTTIDDGYVRNTTLKKVLEELLHITTDSRAQDNTTSTIRCREHCTTFTLHCIAAIRNDRENPRDGNQDNRSSAQRHMQRSEERRLRAALLSLCTSLCLKYSIKVPDLATMVEQQQVSREYFVGKIGRMVEENRCATPACLAILKLTCQMVEELILDDQTRLEVETREKMTGALSWLVSTLSEASKTMSGVETCMLFGGTDRDCYGVPAKPLLSVLVRQVEQCLQDRKDGLGMNTPGAGGP